MKNGDISNEVVPRLLIEFEDLIAHLPEATNRRWAIRPRQNGKRSAQVEAWEIDDLVVKVMWDLTWRARQQLEVITIQGEDFALRLANRLDVEQVPAQRVWHADPRMLARRLVAMPYVSAVYTGSPERAALYGKWGRLVSPDNVQSMGRF